MQGLKAFRPAAQSRRLISQGVHVHSQVNDGSTLSGLQVVVQPEVPGYDLLENGTINTGAAVRVQGQLVESPGRNQKVCTAFILHMHLCKIFYDLYLAPYSSLERSLWFTD